jgi:hypothetical protein
MRANPDNYIQHIQTSPSIEHPNRPFNQRSPEFTTPAWVISASNSTIGDDTDITEVIFNNIVHSGEMVSWEFIEDNNFDDSMIEYLSSEGLILED